MKIHKSMSIGGSDYYAVMICEHCDEKSWDARGYNDSHYHKHVIPNKACPHCGKNRAGEMSGQSGLSKTIPSRYKNLAR